MNMVQGSTLNNSFRARFARAQAAQAAGARKAAKAEVETLIKAIDFTPEMIGIDLKNVYQMDLCVYEEDPADEASVRLYSTTHGVAQMVEVGRFRRELMAPRLTAASVEKFIRDNCAGWSDSEPVETEGNFSTYKVTTWIHPEFRKAERNPFSFK